MTSKIGWTTVVFSAPKDSELIGHLKALEAKHKEETEIAAAFSEFAAETPALASENPEWFISMVANTYVDILKHYFGDNHTCKVESRALGSALSYCISGGAALTMDTVYKAVELANYHAERANTYHNIVSEVRKKELVEARAVQKHEICDVICARIREAKTCGKHATAIPQLESLLAEISNISSFK